MRVLIVEDEKKMASFVRKALLAEGFAVDVLHAGDEALALAAETAFDVILLDMMLPGCDGLTVLRHLRAKNVLTPVLILTARGHVDDRVDGLNAGADDYLSKPFVLAELIARVKAMTRRKTGVLPVVLSVKDLTLDTVTRLARRGNRIIELSPREYRLLEYLLRSPGRICSRMAIIEAVWDYTFDPGTNLVDVYMKRLRDKIDGSAEIKLVHTVRGVGYVIKAGQ